MRTIDHSKNIIEVKNVSFSFDNGLEVLSNISLNIHRGDYLALIGPNGGGKTTLLKIMLGLLKPQKGSVEIFGTNVRKFKGWSKIGYVPQNAVSFDFNFPATAEEIVSMGLYGKKGFFKSLNREDKENIDIALKNVGMSKYRSSLIGGLSGGQKQRIFIARALASNPEILFLDEPTAGVDSKTQKDFYALLRDLNEKYDLTLILITHDIDSISKEATELALINQKLIYYGAPEKL